MGGKLLAHGLGGRSDLPVAPWLATYAGAVVVAISFFAVSALWTQTRFAGGGGGVLLRPLQWRSGSTAARVLGPAVGLRFLPVF